MRSLALGLGCTLMLMIGCSDSEPTAPSQPQETYQAELVTVAAEWADCYSLGCQFRGEARNIGNYRAQDPRGFIRLYDSSGQQIGTAFEWRVIEGGSTTSRGTRMVNPGQTFIYQSRTRVPNATVSATETYSFEAVCGDGSC